MVQWNLSIEGTLNKNHLSNEDTVFAEFSIYMAVWEWSVQDAVVSLNLVCVCVCTHAYIGLVCAGQGMESFLVCGSL